MQTRSRAHEVHGVGDAPEPQLNGADQAPPHELPLPREQSSLNGQIVPPRLIVPDSRCIYPSGRTSHGSICGATPHQSAPSFTSSKSRIVLSSQGGGAEVGGGKHPSFSTRSRSDTRTVSPPIATTHGSPPIKGSGGPLFGICRCSTTAQPLLHRNFNGSTSGGR
ncbi:UNVERIFIED_CONTAM: hypothetical protein Sradi_2527900 [Sesamum radiatum]|uniref:Uncharacterized protein n=1 Tax=Sesamum radiatum TaxID=300843 RepID=A0AAW2SKJ4_SESRA